MSELQIKETKQADLLEILEIHKLAFQEEDVATLTKNLLEDSTALPLLSLTAFVDEKAVGHILFTRAWFKDKKDDQTNIQILAPLAVLPDFQKQGVGGKLVKKGLEILTERGTDLVFVLGHKTYYPKFGFIPDAVSMGMPAPYEIPEKDWDAWMVQTLNGRPLNDYCGQIMCAEAMDRPEYWRE